MMPFRDPQGKHPILHLHTLHYLLYMQNKLHLYRMSLAPWDWKLENHEFWMHFNTWTLLDQKKAHQMS